MDSSTVRQAIENAFRKLDAQDRAAGFLQPASLQDVKHLADELPKLMDPEAISLLDDWIMRAQLNGKGVVAERMQIFRDHLAKIQSEG